jgi:hypothetical protein
MFDAAQNKLALVGNVYCLSPDLPNEHYSLPEKLFGGFSIRPVGAFIRAHGFFLIDVAHRLEIIDAERKHQALFAFPYLTLRCPRRRVNSKS